MKRTKVYEYDRRNREQVVEAISAQAGQVISWSLFAQEGERIAFPVGTQSVFVDASSLFAMEERAAMSISYLEKIIAVILRTTKYKMFLIVERKYSQIIKDLVYYRVSKICSLEEELQLQNCVCKNIVDISQKEYDAVFSLVQGNLFGNEAFKEQLKKEMEKFRVFNLAGYQAVFSVLLCGNTGIGKTELARLLHHGLAGGEPMVKINFGNYSSENSLNSLIGSPRGYVGSNKGELSEKLANSRSTVILIDEFEKASKPVYNFFLQLLEDGKFTDSLGREYDLNKYIIIFTSNLQYEKITERLSPELCSRYNLIYRMEDLSAEEKSEYVSFKVDNLLQIVEKQKNISVPADVIQQIKDIDVNEYQDMRRLNGEMMRRVAQRIYPLIFSGS